MPDAEPSLASTLQRARSRWKRLKDDAGITKVVVVDDQVDDPNALLHLRQVAELRTKIRLGNATFMVSEAGTEEAYLEQVNSYLESLRESDDGPETAYRADWFRLGGQYPQIMGGLAWLAAIFEGILTAVDESGWEIEQKRIQEKEAEGKTLVIFDRVLGDQLTRGDELARAWLQIAPPTTRAIVLTSGAGTEEDGEKQSEMRLAREVAEGDIGLAPRVIVVSKDRLNEQGLLHIVDAIRVGLSAPDLERLRARIADLLGKTHSQAVTEMVNYDLRTLEDIVVRSARKEGAFEADTLIRAVGLRHRELMREVLTNALDELLPMLEQVRGYALITSPGDDVRSREQARLLDRVAHWEAVKTINQPGVPLENGDMLRIGDDYWIVCEQSCDLALRDTADQTRLQRSLDLAPVSTIGAEHPPARHELPSAAPGTDADLKHINLGKVIEMPILVADLCSLEPEGRSRLVLNAPAEITPLTPGLTWLREQAVDFIQARVDQLGPQNLKLSLGALPTAVTVDVDDATVTFNCVRVGRLAKPYADALLGEVHAYNARAAHDHDLNRFGEA